MIIDFFEHDNCIGNEIQRKVLHDLGYTINRYSILDINWNPKHLHLFFKNEPVCTWFDYSAPSIEKKLFDPETINENEALEFMVKDKRLIKRPLIHFNGEYCSGFETPLVEKLIKFRKRNFEINFTNTNLCANYKSWKQYKSEI